MISYGYEDDMPIIIAKTPNYEGEVTAIYDNGKVITNRSISVSETFFALLVATVCVTMYILIVIYIYKRKKRKNIS